VEAIVDHRAREAVTRHRHEGNVLHEFVNGSYAWTARNARRALW
jgi:hypothetical protein